MSGIRLSVLTVACITLSLPGVRGQGQNSPAVFSPTSGDYATADIRVITPGVVFASGLPDIAGDFTKATGKKPILIGVSEGAAGHLGGDRLPGADRRGGGSDHR